MPWSRRRPISRCCGARGSSITSALRRCWRAQFPDLAETQPELLAHHYTEAGLAAQAVGYWQRAGEHAAARSAHVEAIGHFTKGLEVLDALPDTPERAQQELALQRALGASLLATRGYAAPEVEHAYTRARALCQQVGRRREIFPVLSGLWGFYYVRGELQTARELAEHLLTLAQGQHDPAFLLEGHRALGVTLFQLGELSRPAPTWSRAWPCTILSSTAPMPSSMGKTLAWVPGLCGPGPVGAGLSGPGPAAESRGAHPGARAVAPL